MTCPKNPSNGQFLKLHGKSKTRTYKAWKSMRYRCENPTNKYYSNYGGGGILVCKRWQSFENFLHDMGEKPPGLWYLDRKNNNKGYSPKNCRWATAKESTTNRRITKFVKLFGELISMAEANRRLGLSHCAISVRAYNYKITPQEALEYFLRKMK